MTALIHQSNLRSQGVLFKWYTAPEWTAAGPAVRGREEASVNEGEMVLASDAPVTRRHPPARRGRPARAAPPQARTAAAPGGRVYLAVRLPRLFLLLFFLLP